MECMDGCRPLAGDDYKPLLLRGGTTAKAVHLYWLKGINARPMRPEFLDVKVGDVVAVKAPAAGRRTWPKSST